MFKILKINIQSGMTVDILRGYIDFKSATAEAVKLEHDDDLHFYFVRSEIE